MENITETFVDKFYDIIDELDKLGPQERVSILHNMMLDSVKLLVLEGFNLDELIELSNVEFNNYGLTLQRCS